jgi:hypothetical protein
VDDPFPTDTEAFLALLALLEQQGVPKSGRIASCTVETQGAEPVYRVRSSESAKRLVAHALSDCLCRSIPDDRDTWMLSLDDIERLLEQQGLHHVINARRSPEWLKRD